MVTLKQDLNLKNASAYEIICNKEQYVCGTDWKVKNKCIHKLIFPLQLWRSCMYKVLPQREMEQKSLEKFQCFGYHQEASLHDDLLCHKMIQQAQSQ